MNSLITASHDANPQTDNKIYEDNEVILHSFTIIPQPNTFWGKYIPHPIFSVKPIR